MLGRVSYIIPQIFVPSRQHQHGPGGPETPRAVTAACAAFMVVSRPYASKTLHIFVSDETRSAINIMTSAQQLGFPMRYHELFSNISDRGIASRTNHDRIFPNSARTPRPRQRTLPRRPAKAAGRPVEANLARSKAFRALMRSDLGVNS
jgi:hypothetical protein